MICFPSIDPQRVLHVNQRPQRYFILLSLEYLPTPMSNEHSNISGCTNHGRKDAICPPLAFIRESQSLEQTWGMSFVVGCINTCCMKTFTFFEVFCLLIGIHRVVRYQSLILSSLTTSIEKEPDGSGSLTLLSSLLSRDNPSIISKRAFTSISHLVYFFFLQLFKTLLVDQYSNQPR